MVHGLATYLWVTKTSSRIEFVECPVSLASQMRLLVGIGPAGVLLQPPCTLPASRMLGRPKANDW
jgi:hypothetical protein